MDSAGTCSLEREVSRRPGRVGIAAEPTQAYPTAVVGPRGPRLFSGAQTKSFLSNARSTASAAVGRTPPPALYPASTALGLRPCDLRGNSPAARQPRGDRHPGRMIHE